jgi:hypothetical protein
MRCGVLAVLLVLGSAWADPVPERTEVRNRHGSRGLDELREPKGATGGLRMLLRSCLPCHSGGHGPKLFSNGYLLSTVEKEALTGEINGVLNRGIHGGWVREVAWSAPVEERVKLATALDLLYSGQR